MTTNTIQEPVRTLLKELLRLQVEVAALRREEGQGAADRLHDFAVRVAPGLDIDADQMLAFILEEMKAVESN